MLDLALVWAAIIALGVLIYVILDGFDLGIGILFAFFPDEEHRQVMITAAHISALIIIDRFNCVLPTVNETDCIQLITQPSRLMVQAIKTNQRMAETKLSVARPICPRGKASRMIAVNIRITTIQNSIAAKANKTCSLSAKISGCAACNRAASSWPLRVQSS